MFADTVARRTGAYARGYTGRPSTAAA